MARSRPALRLGDCSFEPPSDWSAEVVATGPSEGGFRPNFAVQSDPSLPDEDAEDFAARTLAILEKTFVEYELLDEGPAVFGEHKGWLREHTFLHGDTRFGQYQFLLVSHGVARTFTFTHLATHLAGRRGAAEYFFTTIRIFPPTPERMRVAPGIRG
jgi:hypothetical protein